MQSQEKRPKGRPPIFNEYSEITLQVEREFKDRITLLAKNNGVSRSAFIRAMLESALAP